MFLASCQYGNHEKPYFSTREEADESCNKFAKDKVKEEIEKSSDSRFYENYTHIKSDYEEFAILDYGCKPSFKKGSTTGRLIPFYSYLDENGTIEKRRIWPENYSNDPKYKFSYPLKNPAQSETGLSDASVNPFFMPYSSIRSQDFLTGIGYGSVFRTCRDVYRDKILTEAQGEQAIIDTKEFLSELINDNQVPFGPISSNSKDLIYQVLDGRWKNCKKKGYDGWD